MSRNRPKPYYGTPKMKLDQPKKATVPGGATIYHDPVKNAFSCQYPCGHVINIPGTAIAKAKKAGTRYAPDRCPTCAMRGASLLKDEHVNQWGVMSQNMLHNGPFTFTPNTASASHGSSPLYHWNEDPVYPRTVDYGPLAWLEFELDRVTKRAFH